MDCKEEISDTDSGIILQCGPDSPSSPLKDVSGRSQAARLRQQALQDRLGECLRELKHLCIREAELTGHLSSDYPLLPGEKPPVIRRRIGTAFRLDEESILQGGEHPELGPLEAELALQLQIYEAARRLCHEEHLSRAVRRSRLQQCQGAQRKLQELQEAAFQLRLRLGRGSPRPPRPPRPIGSRIWALQITPPCQTPLCRMKKRCRARVQTRSLEASPVPDPLQPAPGSPPRLLHAPWYPPLQVLEELTPCHSPSLDYDKPPIQNSPWTESSLDQPYQKPKKKSRSACNSHTSSPMVTPTVTPTVTPMSTPASTPVDSPFGSSAHPLHFTPIKGLELRHAQCHSAPCTPELQLRRQQSQSFRLPSRELSHESGQPRGRSRLARRRIVEFGEAPGERGPLQVGLGGMLYPSSSEDSCSEHSAPSYASSPCCDFPVELTDPRLPQYGYPNDGPHVGPPNDGPHSGPRPYDGPHSRALPYDGPHSGPLPYDGPHGGPLPYDGPHSRAYTGPHGGPLPYDGPHSRAYTGPHGGPLPYDGPHSRAYTGPHGGPLPYDGPHSRAYTGPHGGPLPYDGPHSRALPYDRPHGGPVTYTGTFYKNPMHQSSPSFYGGYIEDNRGYPPEMDIRRLYLGPPPPSGPAGPPGRYEHWGLPCDLVSDGLKSWQQRGQQGAPPRPRSLDRQGAVRVRSVQERESPLAHPPRQHRQPQQQPPHRYQEQGRPRQILQRGPDGAPVQWFTQEDSEIASQL
ncbi:hypothetical protein ANANG_G00242830 [Anguilla anguilla]|uniref:Cytohesin Ubiquitin Protein Inducing domain-containing protein n=1 Tax=Anguilla anguilla TaxID=7936 RepID=A0A9D3LV26_ANGAN|nr:hypothetical protein ANANG_G00242830 [Anguilla anguilla]